MSQHEVHRGTGYETSAPPSSPATWSLSGRGRRWPRLPGAHWRDRPAGAPRSEWHWRANKGPESPSVHSSAVTIRSGTGKEASPHAPRQTTLGRAQLSSRTPLRNSRSVPEFTWCNSDDRWEDARPRRGTRHSHHRCQDRLGATSALKLLAHAIRTGCKAMPLQLSQKVEHHARSASSLKGP